MFKVAFVKIISLSYFLNNSTFQKSCQFLSIIVFTKYNVLLLSRYISGFWPKILLFKTHHLWNYTTEMALLPIGLLTFFVYFKAWKYFKDYTHAQKRNLNQFFLNENLKSSLKIQNIKCLTCNYAQRTQPKVHSSWTFFWYFFWTFRFPLQLLRVVLKHIGDGQLARSTNDCHLMVLLVEPNKHDLLLKQPGAFQLQGTTDL